MTPLHRFLLRFFPPALATLLLAAAYATGLLLLLLLAGREPAEVLYLDLQGGG